ncbi:hypothetical protein POX_b03452 [Penicillium oxalicum]|uniref:Uncharacterized protein n=1 Tax=Penicillium oxalicum (strain 114-2 / CGMCC 5302) TaxID=933388 RepID=S8B4N3_PENO1|nr:hypothetical protein POX_b03452 [Penicillium oxalicum]EPS29522.1 hypothetical protein PDE_04472 [Penicillium oxalicum 114-2]KAI2793397.1 hypothetical protein POX_b03452 [Penicillium oxalicum]
MGRKSQMIDTSQTDSESRGERGGEESDNKERKRHQVIRSGRGQLNQRTTGGVKFSSQSPAPDLTSRAVDSEVQLGGRKSPGHRPRQQGAVDIEEIVAPPQRASHRPADWASPTGLAK